MLKLRRESGFPNLESIRLEDRFKKYWEGVKHEREDVVVYSGIG